MQINKKRVYALIAISLAVLALINLWAPSAPKLEKGDRKNIAYLPSLATNAPQAARDIVDEYIINNISKRSDEETISTGKIAIKRQYLNNQAKTNLEQYTEDDNSPIIEYLINKEMIRILTSDANRDIYSANEIISIYTDLLPNSADDSQSSGNQDIPDSELNDIKMKNLPNTLKELGVWIDVVIKADAPIHNQTLQAQSILIISKLADIGEFEYIFNLLDRLPDDPKDLVSDYNKIALAMMHLYGVGTEQNNVKGLEIIDTYIKLDSEAVATIKTAVQVNTQKDAKNKNSPVDPQIESAEYYLPMIGRLYINGYIDEPNALSKGCAMIYATLDSGYKTKRNKIVSNAKEVERYKVFCDEKLTDQEKESIKEITKIYTNERQDQLDIIAQFGALKDDYIMQNSDALQNHINNDPYYTSTTLVEDSINRKLPNLEAYTELGRALNYNAYECNSFAQTLLAELYRDNIGVDKLMPPKRITKFHLSNNPKVNACMWGQIANLDPYNIQWCNEKLTSEERVETYTQIQNIIKSDSRIFNCTLYPQ